MEYVRKCGKMGETFRMQLTLKQSGVRPTPLPSVVKNLHINLNTPKLQYIALKSEPCHGDSEKTSFISYTTSFSFLNPPRNSNLHCIEHEPKLIEVAYRKIV